MKRLGSCLLLVALCLWLIPQIAWGAHYVAKYGSRGEKVEEIQAMLNHMHLYNYAIDGDFGSQTLAAVKKFQRQSRRPQDGVVDAQLYKMMSRKSGLDFAKYRKAWVMEATGYSAYDPGCRGYTATGLPLRRGIIAVDPLIIPLGTQVYVMGYGMAVAQDTGGAIKGNVIDLAFSSRGEALQWGRRRVRVYIL
jgi:3D (Asp-Asp-Asp) domain-containing protein